jgi:hypothetical protein
MGERERERKRERVGERKIQDSRHNSAQTRHKSTPRFNVEKRLQMKGKTTRRTLHYQRKNNTRMKVRVYSQTL